MTPQLVTAIAYLIAETAATGVSLASLFEQVRATGRVSDEQWAVMKTELTDAMDAWEAAGNPSAGS